MIVYDKHGFGHIQTKSAYFGYVTFILVPLGDKKTDVYGGRVTIENSKFLSTFDYDLETTAILLEAI